MPSLCFKRCVEALQDFKSDLASFKDVLAGAGDEDWPQDMAEECVKDAKEVLMMAAGTKLGYKMLVDVYSDKTIPEQIEGTKQALNKFNRYRIFQLSKAVHPAVLKLKDDVLAKGSKK